MRGYTQHQKRKIKKQHKITIKKLPFFYKRMVVFYYEKIYKIILIYNS